MQVKRVARFVEATPADAWVVCAGSREVLEWFAQQHLARRGIVAPEQVSLVCDDPDQTFTWCDPAISHIRWDYLPVVRRVLRWTNNVARGQDDLRQTFTKSEFVEGGTVGPVPAGP